MDLKRTGKITESIPSMCVLVVKNDKDGNPLREKSSIVVLGNFEYRLYHKSQRYAPILKYIPLCLINDRAIGEKHILQKGNCKNALYNVTLQEYEFTVIRPQLATLLSITTNTVSSTSTRPFITSVVTLIIGTI